MFNTDEDIILYSLSMWQNYIQTGNVSLSSEDAMNMKKPNLINPLNLDQIKFIARIETIKEKLREQRN